MPLCVWYRCVAGNGSVTPAGEMFTRRFSHGCRAGSTGPFCELCLDNHYKSDGVCVECTGGGMELIMLLIPGSILALAILGCLVFVGCACRKHAATLQEKLTDHVQGESEIDGNADAADAHTNSTMKDLYKQKTRMRRQMDKGRPRIGSLPCQGVDLSTLQTDFKILVSLIQVCAHGGSSRSTRALTSTLHLCTHSSSPLHLCTLVLTVGGACLTVCGCGALPCRSSAHSRSPSQSHSRHSTRRSCAGST